MSDCHVSYLLHLVRIPYDHKIRYSRYYIHKLIWEAFPNKTDYSQSIPFLYRIIKLDRKGSIYCLIQSCAPPTWSNISEERIEIINSKNIDFTTNSNDQFYFRLIASPVKHTFISNKIRGRKTPMTKSIDIEKWLFNKANLSGFKIHELVTSADVIKIRKNLATNAQDINLSCCNFDGYLTVTNPKEFSAALNTGIGPKKSFGFGMLTIGREI